MHGGVMLLRWSSMYEMAVIEESLVKNNLEWKVKHKYKWKYREMNKINWLKYVYREWR